MDKKNQTVEYLESNFLGIGFQELHDHVIKKENCVFCGTCTTLCPRIGMNDKKPVLLESDPECSTCFRYCPMTYFPEDVFEEELFNGKVNKSYSLGFYQDLISAKSADKQVLKVAQNGGVVSSLLIHALEAGIIDGALLTGRDENWYPKPFIARTAEEILSCTGSKYTITPTLSIYKDAAEVFELGNLAFVGMPCQIKAVRKLQLSSPLSNEFGKFTLVIGLYCYSNYSYDLMKVYIQEELGISLKNVMKIDISKGKFYVYVDDGSVKEVPIKNTKKYDWKSCQYCKDFSAELADISIGSVGAYGDDWNSVIVRTDLGKNLFNGAVEAEKIITSNETDRASLEEKSLRKKTRLTQIDQSILDALLFLDVTDFEIKTYTTLMSLGFANTFTLSKIMNAEENSVERTLSKLKQREWIVNNNGLYSSANPTLVINNEISKLRKQFLKKIDNLKTGVLPDLETLYAQNNHVRHEDLDLI
ncbi:MAG: Coenzyme F420 hydrogenase/dehydrogenase, beta subunit C-terminal domain [Promethearchaeota archaeon]|jgi:coenzyme F420 hydrogenase subunit beta